MALSLLRITLAPLVIATMFKGLVAPLYSSLESTLGYCRSLPHHQWKIYRSENIGRAVNEFCTPHIQSWWLDTQDQLVREGTEIREKLVQEIQEQIQEISNELSNYLGEALQVELKINPIQFPSFDFEGIDAQINHQQEVYTRTKKDFRVESRCCDSDKVYEVDIPYQDQRSFPVSQHLPFSIRRQASDRLYLGRTKRR